MNRRQFVAQAVAHSAAAITTGQTVFASRGPETQRPKCKYRIAYNDDGHTLQHSSGLDDLLKKGVDCFIGTQVDALFWSVGHSDIYLFDTKTGEMFGQHVKQFDNASEYRLYKGLQSVLNDRRDFLQSMVDRARKIGIHFFASFRMNDCHDSPEGWNARDQYSRFKKAHPELLLGDSVHPAFATGYDFAFPESRQNKFQVIEEVVRDYDVDGIELDFLRHPAFFKPDNAFRQRHLMTGLVRRVRTLLDDVGARRRQAIRLAVRVPFTAELANKLGIDLPVWIEDGLLDVVTAGTPRGHELDLSMSEPVDAIRSKGVTLLGQIGLYHPLKQTRATASNYWKQGVDGIYLFNWYAPLRNRDRWRESLLEIGDPSLLSGRNKQYVIDKQIGGMWIGSHPKAQLPLEIGSATSDKGAEIKFYVGDDLDAAAAGGNPAGCEMVMRFEEAVEDDDLQLKLNGVFLPQELGKTEFKPTLFSKEHWFHLPFKARLLKTGVNRLEFMLRARNPRVAAPLVLADMSVRIDYGTGR